MTEPPRTWTILAVLKWTTSYFQEKGVAEPRASAEVLLAHILGVSRLDLYLRHDQPLTPEELASFKALIRRRVQGEPTAYLTGHKEFWSLDFLVTPATLIPRPETEVLVEGLLEVVGEKAKGLRPFHPPPHPLPQYHMHGWEREEAAAPPALPSPSPLALEVGVGSGAVVVALARELPGWRWLGVDISAGALAVARENARRLGVAHQVWFLQGNLLACLKPGPRFQVIVANLPYISQEEWDSLPVEVREYEPRTALWGGPDGLALLTPFCRAAHRFLAPGGWLALEVGATQAEVVVALLAESEGYARLETLTDYRGLPRVIRARRVGKD
jgi:release factor glutamine methyltransferase